MIYFLDAELRIASTVLLLDHETRQFIMTSQNYIYHFSLSPPSLPPLSLSPFLSLSLSRHSR